jgi:cysteine desulfurase/selenocysteine lyase
LREIPKLRVLGPLDLTERRGVVSFVLDGVSAEQICRYLDTHGVALRGGHHCAQPVMRAFGVDASARASLAPYSTAEDIEALLEGLEALCKSKELSRS